jgi:molybdate transport system permease protein
LPLAIYSFMHVPGGEAAAARLVVLSLALALAALAGSHWLTRRAERRLGYHDHDPWATRGA